MASAKALYERWINALWAGKDVAAEIVTDDGPMSFTGNDILRIKDGRFAEYWTGTSAG
jgi:hypothetical protein